MSSQVQQPPQRDRTRPWRTQYVTSPHSAEYGCVQVSHCSSFSYPNTQETGRYCPHFTEREPEAQRQAMTWQSLQVRGHPRDRTWPLPDSSFRSVREKDDTGRETPHAAGLRSDAWQAEGIAARYALLTCPMLILAIHLVSAHLSVVKGPSLTVVKAGTHPTRPSRL